MMTLQRQNRLRTMIQRSRARLMVDNPEFALVLMYFRYVATKQVHRISTNGRMVYFDPDWLQKLSGQEMDYILVHQALHFVRRDVSRPAFFAGDRYHHACDIILNSFIRQMGMRADKLPHIGELPHTTYFPNYEGSILTPIEAMRAVPFDPASMTPGRRRFFQIDSDEWWGHSGMPEDGTLILYPGYKGLSDEVIKNPENDENEVLKPKYQKDSLAFTGFLAEDSDDDASPDVPSGDSGTEELDAAIDRLLHMIECMDSTASQHAEVMDRVLHGVAEAKLEWQKLLNLFLQEEIHDYSFQPPDRRFTDSGFFLPDFNERDDSIRNVLFMVDSSGSVDDGMISVVYREISAAIEQFNGKMSGMLAFFNTEVTTPRPFCTIAELLRIRPHGYGGTDFGCIFRYIAAHPELEPSCIVVFTDGKGTYPPEEAACGIPVLWILHGIAGFPKWGRTARIV